MPSRPYGMPALLFSSAAASVAGSLVTAATTNTTAVSSGSGIPLAAQATNADQPLAAARSSQQDSGKFIVWKIYYLYCIAVA